MTTALHAVGIVALVVSALVTIVVLFSHWE